MKIIYDYKIFWLQKYGGISRYFSNLMKNLQSNSEFDFKIIAPFYKNSYIKQNINKEKIFGTYIEKPFPKTSFILKLINEKFFQYGTKYFNPDIIHSTYYNQNINSRKKPLVLTVYDTIHEKLSLKNNNAIFAKQKSIDIADRIICISNNTKKDLLKLYKVNEKKISVIHLGADHLSNLNYQTNHFKNKILSYSKKPFLLYVGSRNKYKNFNFFIKAIGISNKIQNDFDIILFGGGSLTKKEQLEIERLKLKNIYTIEGNDNLLAELYKNAKLFVFPSIYEGFGLPLLEAMSLGCPVLCSKNNTFEELVGKNAIYFDPNDIYDFKFQIENLIYSETKLKELKSLGIKKSNDYTWKKCSNKTLELYKSLI